MDYIGKTIKVADTDGDLYDAKIVRRNGDFYVAEMPGLTLQVPEAEVKRQMRRQLVKGLWPLWLVLGLMALVWGYVLVRS